MAHDDHADEFNERLAIARDPAARREARMAEVAELVHDLSPRELDEALAKVCALVAARARERH